jgi:hypothetical protein
VVYLVLNLVIRVREKMSFEENDNSLVERVARLEMAVARLEAALNQMQPTATVAPFTAPTWMEEKLPDTGAGSPAAVTVAGKRSRLPAPMQRSEFWLHLTGVVLLLFAVAFLFKYAVDQGWLTPAVRVIVGLIVGTAMLTAGWWQRQRPVFGGMLLGGALGAYYITGFAAFQLYDLVPHTLAFGFMVANTLLAFSLALGYDKALLALLGAGGGLATPFLLYTGAGNVEGLVAYTSLVLAGIALIYWYQGWQLLLWLAVTGGWLTLIIGTAGAPAVLSSSQAWALQLGVVFAWLLFWLIPVARQTAVTLSWDRWRPTTLGVLGLEAMPALQRFLRADVLLLTAVTPLIALGLTLSIWPGLASQSTGWIALALAFVYGTAVLFLRRWAPANLALVHGATAALMLAISLWQLLDGSMLLVAYVALALVLQILARLSKRRVAVVGADLFALAVTLWLLDRLTGLPPSRRTAEINWQAAVDLVAIMAAATIAWKIRSGRAQTAYGLLAHAGLLLWFWRELAGLPQGHGLVSAAWGTYAVVLLLAGLRLDAPRLRQMALASLALLVAKLFVVDLAHLDPLWRIVLFFAFGGLFLALSYGVTRLWRPGPPRAAL